MKCGSCLLLLFCNVFQFVYVGEDFGCDQFGQIGCEDLSVVQECNVGSNF